MVRPAVAEHRGHDAQADPDDQGQHDREQRQLDRGRDVLGQVGADRPVALLGDAEVSVQQVLQVQHVLHRQRPVQAVLVPEGRHRGRVADGALPEVGGGRVTGHQVGEHERDQRDADAQHQAGPEPLQQEAAQVAVPAPGPGARRRGSHGASRAH